MATVAAPNSSALMPLEEALERLLGSIDPIAERDAVATEAAAGRVLAQDVVAPLDVPGFDNSQMDGYAVRCADVAAAVVAGRALPVTQRIAAGHFGTSLAPGTVARIFTGAPIPAGADAVVPQEAVQIDGSSTDGAFGAVRFQTVPQLGQWIRVRGEDIQRGAVVLQAGQRLSAADTGLAASVGCDQLSVVRRVRVALLSTGDELVTPGTVPPDQLPPGAIYNSNRYFLLPLLQRLGCEVTVWGNVADTLDATRSALAQAAHEHDVIITTGGVSVGEEDHVKPAVQAMGQLDLWRLAIKPGRPFAHGWIDRTRWGGAGRCHVLGLPGNPVASFVTCLLLVRPALLRLAGVRNVPAVPAALPMVAHFEWTQPDPKRREFLRVRRNIQGGLDLFPNQNSSVLTSAAWADGLVDNPPGQTIARGDLVRYYPLAILLE